MNRAELPRQVASTSYEDGTVVITVMQPDGGVYSEVTTVSPARLAVIQAFKQAQVLESNEE